MAVFFIVAGLVLLTFGAELLVRGASGLARAIGLPSLIIGLTVVAFGTSAPELAVSIGAGLSGDAGIAVGNAVGSNTFNILFILGLSSLITPLAVSSQLVRLDVPIMIIVAGVVWWMSSNGDIGRAQGLSLVAALVLYTSVLIVLGMRTGADAAATAPTNDDGPTPQGESPAKDLIARPRLPASVALVTFGLLLLVFGARLLVSGAIDVARAMGVSELLIGLTIVAAGTSLPEVATSVVAAMRGQRDMAIGNIVGSNIFNMLGVLGAAAAIAANGLAVERSALTLDFPVMIAASVVCLPLFITGARLSRREGALLLAGYIAYLSFLILAAVSPAH